jgi:integrase
MRFDDLDIGALKLPTAKRSVTFTTEQCPGLTFQLKRGRDRRIRREFHLRYTRPDGTRSSKKVGEYPAIDATQAIAAGLELRALVARGVDPAMQARATRTKARQTQMLVGQALDARYRLTSVAAEWLGELEQHRRPATVTKYRQAITLYLIPEFGGTDIRLFERARFEQYVRTLGQRSKAAANNLFATTRAMMSWAVEHDRIPANSLAGRRALLEDIRLQPRKRVLSSAELHKFVTELEQQPIGRDVRVLLRLQLLSGARIGELAGLLWAEVDVRGRVLKVPASRTKAKRDIEIVLSDAARRLLLEWRRETLELGLLRVFRDHLDTRQAVEEIRKLQDWIAFGTHDLRRTVRSQLQRLGCPLEVRSLISNHNTPVGVAKHYDHSKTRREQLQWLESWSAALVAVAEDPTALEDELTAADDALLAEFADVLP